MRSRSQPNGCGGRSNEANGNVTSLWTPAGTTNLNYNYDDKPTSITGPGYSQTNTFNAAGARTKKVYNGSTKNYFRTSPGVTAPVLSDGAKSIVPGISEKPNGGSTNVLHGDRLGSIQQTSSTSGTANATITFDAFGVNQSSTNWTSQSAFAGQWGYQQDENGLQQVGHRLYDPNVGRFLTRDPMGSGSNWYGYCENNPVNQVDPLGLWIHDAVPPSASRDWRYETPSEKHHRRNRNARHRMGLRAKLAGKNNRDYMSYMRHLGLDGTDCGRFVYYCVSEWDPGYKSHGTTDQYNHLASSPLWRELGPDEESEEGDIAIITAAQRGSDYGHTMIMGSDGTWYNASLHSHGPQANENGPDPHYHRFRYVGDDDTPDTRWWLPSDSPVRI